MILISLHMICLGLRVKIGKIELIDGIEWVGMLVLVG